MKDWQVITFCEMCNRGVMRRADDAGVVSGGDCPFCALDVMLRKVDALVLAARLTKNTHRTSRLPPPERI